MKKKIKLFIKIGIITVLILLLGFIALLIPAIRTVKISSHRIDCINQLHGICLAVQDYHYRDKINHEKLPFYGDKTTGEEYWSWRAVWILSGYPYQKAPKFRLTEPWNSEYNLPLFKEKPYPNYFFCPGDEQREKASYVAVTGPGTVWTELQNDNLLKYTWDYSEMIFIIETPFPKNFWAEPGDDVTPEDVIRLFEADPGLVKNSKQKWWDFSHWPKNYVSFDGVAKNFDEIKDVEELRKMLILPPEALKMTRPEISE